MLLLPIILGLLGVVSSLLIRREYVAYPALMAVLFLGVLVPSHYPPQRIIIISLLAALVILSVAILRVVKYMPGTTPNVWLLGYIGYSTLTQMLHSSGPYLLVIAVSGLGYILLSLLVSTQTSSASRALVWSLLVLGTLEAGWAVGELYFGTQPLWLRGDSVDLLANRENMLAPWLPGRAMGTMAQPIPLGILAGLAFFVIVWMIIRRRKYAAIPVGVAIAFCVLASGTRSSIVALAAVSIYLLITRLGWKHIWFYAGLISVVCLTVLLTDSLDVWRNSTLASSRSFEHRFGVLSFVPLLLTRPFGEMIWGTGSESIARLLSSSRFSGADGILVLDQEYVRTFVSMGLVGLLLLIGAGIYGFSQADSVGRSILVFLSVSMFSFDVLSWHVFMVIFVIACSFGRDHETVLRPEVDIVVSSTRQRQSAFPLGLSQ